MASPEYAKYRHMPLEEIASGLTTRLGVPVRAEDLRRFAKPIGSSENPVEIASGSDIFGFSDYDPKSQNMWSIFKHDGALGDIESQQGSIGPVDKLEELSRWSLANLLYIIEVPTAPRHLIPID